MLILHAPNVHSGGGRSLLEALLAVIPAGSCVQLDARLVAQEPRIADDVSINVVKPNLRARLAAERQLSALAKRDDIVLCFGNLPPLFPCKARAVVFLQNRYLIGAPIDKTLPRKTRLRLTLERLWFRHLRRESEIVVQTQTMSQLLREYCGADAKVAPFRTPLPPSNTQQSAAIDYLYVASGEAHKNHDILFDAWELLAAPLGKAPTLAVTFDPKVWPRLTQRAQSLGASVTILPAMKTAEMANVYASAKALIFPSRFESFGLPLLEAQEAGLPIVAAELDYVRDVCTPAETFDPTSAVSIARAIYRHQGQPHPTVTPTDAQGFLQQIGIPV